MTNGRGNSRRNNATEKENITMTTDTVPTEISEGGIRVDMNSKLQFTVSIPVGLKIALDKYAKENETSVNDFARSTLATSVGYVLPATAKRSSKFASDDEKKAAQQLRAKARRDLLNRLLEQYDEDEDDDEA